MSYILSPDDFSNFHLQELSLQLDQFEKASKLGKTLGLKITHNNTLQVQAEGGDKLDKIHSFYETLIVSMAENKEYFDSREALKVYRQFTAILIKLMPRSRVENSIVFLAAQKLKANFKPTTLLDSKKVQEFQQAIARRTLFSDKKQDIPRLLEIIDFYLGEMLGMDWAGSPHKEETISLIQSILKQILLHHSLNPEDDTFNHCRALINQTVSSLSTIDKDFSIKISTKLHLLLDSVEFQNLLAQLVQTPKFGLEDQGHITVQAIQEHVTSLLQSHDSQKVADFIEEMGSKIDGTLGSLEEVPLAPSTVAIKTEQLIYQLKAIAYETYPTLTLSVQKVVEHPDFKMTLINYFAQQRRFSPFEVLLAHGVPSLDMLKKCLPFFLPPQDRLAETCTQFEQLLNRYEQVLLSMPAQDTDVTSRFIEWLKNEECLTDLRDVLESKDTDFARLLTEYLASLPSFQALVKTEKSAQDQPTAFFQVFKNGFTTRIRDKQEQDIPLIAHIADKLFLAVLKDAQERIQLIPADKLDMAEEIGSFIQEFKNQVMQYCNEQNIEGLVPRIWLALVHNLETPAFKKAIAILLQSASGSILSTISLREEDLNNRAEKSWNKMIEQAFKENQSFVSLVKECLKNTINDVNSDPADLESRVHRAADTDQLFSQIQSTIFTTAAELTEESLSAYIALIPQLHTLLNSPEFKKDFVTAAAAHANVGREK